MAISKDKVKTSKVGFASAEEAESLDLLPRASLTRFDVTVENAATGTPYITFYAIIAQTRAEAVNKAKQKLTFSAERA